MTEKIRAHVGDATVRLGPISCRGKLLPVRQTEKKEAADEIHFVTPDGKKVNQRFVSDLGGPDEIVWEQKDLAKGTIDESGKVKIVDKDDLDEARKSPLPKNLLDLTVHSAETRTVLYPADTNGYIMFPDESDPKNVDFYNFIVTAVAEGNKTLLGMCNLRGHEGLYTLVLWRGHLVFQRVLYPSELHDHPTRSTTLPREARKAVVEIVDALETEFDPDQYKNDTLARAQAVIDAAANPGAAPKKKVAPVVQQDLMATLESMKALVSS